MLCKENEHAKGNEYPFLGIKCLLLARTMERYHGQWDLNGIAKHNDLSKDLPGDKFLFIPWVCLLGIKIALTACMKTFSKKGRLFA
ncbi:hypothetical protein AN619_11340 [Thermotalea metallivorans]|uniref:Uncharacterized protein n=1 Tax=Thermotalea metallivorans TaxID=520762 RepID=A0A140L6K2_9FIRM|nr:hypothetical protein AN619_11340 [Thermotalea metallivorans]